MYWLMYAVHVGHRLYFEPNKTFTLSMGTEFGSKDVPQRKPR